MDAFHFLDNFSKKGNNKTRYHGPKGIKRTKQKRMPLLLHRNLRFLIKTKQQRKNTIIQKHIRQSDIVCCFNLQETDENGIHTITSRKLRRGHTKNSTFPVFCPICCTKKNTQNIDNKKTNASRREKCNLDFLTREGLWFHCLTFHCDEYKFTAARTKDKLYHISGIQQPLKPYNDHVVKHDTTITRFLETELLYCRTMPLLSSCRKVPSFGFSVREFNEKFLIYPKRQYYHFGTLEKIKDLEYVMNIDCSEDYFMTTTNTKNDPTVTWERILGDSAFNDFTDVSNLELIFCTLWNRFLEINPLILKAEFPFRLLQFVETHAGTVFPIEKEERKGRDNNIVESSNNELFEMLMLFILCRWDDGEINRSQLEYITNLCYQWCTNNEI